MVIIVGQHIYLLAVNNLMDLKIIAELLSHSDDSKMKTIIIKHKVFDKIVY